MHGHNKVFYSSLPTSPHLDWSQYGLTGTKDDAQLK